MPIRAIRPTRTVPPTHPTAPETTRDLGRILTLAMPSTANSGSVGAVGCARPASTPGPIMTSAPAATIQTPRMLIVEAPGDHSRPSSDLGALPHYAQRASGAPAPPPGRLPPARDSG